MNYIYKYNSKIQNGEIITSKKVKTVYNALTQDLKSKKKWIYDSRRADHVIYFIEHFCKHSKGKWANKSVKLELWQKAFISAIFGVINKKTKKRRFTEAILIVAKKNGKSLIASALSLYMLMADGEGGAEVYSVATKRDQAKIVYNESVSMVKKSPVLFKNIKIRVGGLYFEKMDSIYRPLSSDSSTEDGLNIHCATCDEIHAWKTRDLYDIVENGVSAREEPLILLITTAGTEREGLYDIKYDEIENYINNLKDKDAFIDEKIFPVVYELDSKSEWDNPDNWIKANPNLSISKKYEYLERKVANAKENPLNLKNVLTKEFNMRETSTEVWLSFEDIDNPATFDIHSLPDTYGFSGSDLSRTTDLTSACVLFRIPNNPIIYVKSMYWIPEYLLLKRAKEDHIPYDIWYEKGYVRTCNGNNIDYDDVVNWFLEVQDNMGIYLYQHNYDSWNSLSFIKSMDNCFGKISEPVIQGKKTLSNPMRLLGADLCSKNINYDNNPITRWCLTNVRADIDKNDNIQPAKTSNPRRRIDGFASMLNAYVGYVNNKDDYLRLINK